MFKLLFIFLVIFPVVAFAQKTEEVIQKEFESTALKVLGANANEKFSFHKATYAVFGDEDLKLQFSFKYRIAPSFPLYLAYTQLFFWEIYDESKPFKEVNYNPELFYRLMEKSEGSLKNLDMGWMHLSNGEEGTQTRSLDRVFLRSNYLTKLKRHNFDINLMVFHIYNEDDTNKDIVNHMGYWELSTFLSNLIIMEAGHVGLEFKANAGSKVFDLDQGSYQIGLFYVFNSSNFNPSIYLQRFEGYNENLLGFDKKRSVTRLGLNLTF